MTMCDQKEQRTRRSGVRCLVRGVRQCRIPALELVGRRSGPRFGVGTALQTLKNGLRASKDAPRSGAVGRHVHMADSGLLREALHFYFSYR